jgi:predicted DNA-binding transcriptional regulator AlpA
VQVTLGTGLPDSSPPAPEVLLIDAAGAAAMLAISKRHLEDLNREGSVPRPMKLSRSCRWSVTELRQWVQAGCPSRAEWEARAK